MTQKKLKVLVTGGGTRVKIDSVRYLGNFSTGSFAAEIARALTQKGHEVVTLGSTYMIERHTEILQGVSELVPYIYFEDFKDSFAELLTKHQPDVVIMAAALSDFISPDPTEGKIESRSGEGLDLHFVRAPKLLPLARNICGPNTFVVGFKLLVDADDETFVRRAQQQFAEAHTNLCVANDLTEIDGEHHPVRFISPSGQFQPHTVTKEEAAKLLTRLIELHTLEV